MHTTERKPKAVELFSSDHQTVLGKLEKMDTIFFQLEDDPTSLGETDSAFLREMVSIFDTELVVHFQREEKILFPVMERYVPREMGPIAIMLEEHVRIFEAIDKFRKDVNGLTSSGGPSEEAISDMLYNARSLIETLRSHIDKEENVLLPMAESHLTQPEWAAVWRDMEKMTLDTIKEQP